MLRVRMTSKLIEGRTRRLEAVDQRRNYETLAEHPANRPIAAGTRSIASAARAFYRGHTTPVKVLPNSGLRLSRWYSWELSSLGTEQDIPQPT